MGSFPVKGGHGGDNDPTNDEDKNATAKSKFCSFQYMLTAYPLADPGFPVEERGAFW